MQFSIIREELQKALSAVSRAIPSTPVIPIFSHVLLEVRESEELRITGSDMQMAISCKVSIGDLDGGPGTIACPYQILSELTKNCDGDTIKFDYDPLRYNLGFEADGSIANIKCVPADDYPVPDEYAETGMKVSTVEFKNLAETSFTASESIANPVLTGIYLVIDDKGKLSAFTTDGFRFSSQRSEIQGLEFVNQPEPFSAVIPASSMVEAAKIMEGPDTYIRVSDKVGFISGNIQVMCWQINGQFPDWRTLENMVTKTPQTVVTCKTADLVRGVKQASIFSDPEKQQVHIKINPIIMEISSAHTQRGDGKAFVAGVVQGPEMPIKLNFIYLLDALANIGESVQLSFYGTNAAVVLRTEGDDSFYTFVLPIVTPETKEGG